MTVATLPAKQDILALDPDSAAELVYSLMREGTLSALVHQLNADILEGSRATRSEAEAVLEHMGFVL